MNIKGCLSHKTDDWKTPTILYNKLMDNGWLDCFKYQSDYDELEKNYYGCKLFINPPFSKMKKITEWIKRQITNGNDIILLIPSRTDTKYFHDLLTQTPFIYMFEGRLHYNDSKLSAPFPTIALKWSKYKYWFNLYDYGTIEKFMEKYCK